MIDILILSYNRVEYLKECIGSIIKNTPPGEYRLLIGDDCSPDGTMKYLIENIDQWTEVNLTEDFASWEGRWIKKEVDIPPYIPVVIVDNDKNMGGGGAYTLNRLLRYVKYPNVAIVCQDYYMKPGWLEWSINALEDYIELGVVCPYRTPYFSVSGECDDGKILWSDHLIPGGCWVMKKRVIEEVGDWFEGEHRDVGVTDVNYCHRLREHDYVFGISAVNYAFHFGCVRADGSQGFDPGEEGRRFFEEKKFPYRVERRFEAGLEEGKWIEIKEEEEIDG